MVAEDEAIRATPVKQLPPAARSATVEFAGTPHAAPLSRLFLREHLTGHLLADTLATAELLTTELVTNALLHARSRIRLVLHWDDDELVVHVHDAHPGGPNGRHIEIADLEETGRGMTILMALADDFGWSQLPEGTGKVMWFMLALPGLVGS